MTRQVTRDQLEDEMFQIITTPAKTEFEWNGLRATDVRFPALALLANPAFYESVWPRLADEEVKYWACVLDGDPVTIRLIVHEVTERFWEEHMT